jgi:hypothetical protein
MTMTEKRFTKGTEILKKENKCCICNSKNNLEPHHILHTTAYDELHDSIENLVVMCHRTSLLWMGEGIFWCGTCKKYWKQTGGVKNNVEYSTDGLCQQ